MVKWAFMTDPATNNIGLYDEPVPGSSEADYADPNSATNAPLNDPEANLAYVYWHIQFDNMEVMFDTSVGVNHTAVAAASAASGESSQSAGFEVDAAVVDHDLLTHDAGYEPFVVAAIGNSILVPGYPVQVNAAGGAVRCVTLYVTSTKVFMREYRTRGWGGLNAMNQTYRLLVFRQQRPAEGNVPPRLIDVDPVTGLVSLGDGRWRNDRRYLQVVPGGSPLGLPFGRTLDLKNGAFRMALSNGGTVDPITPATLRTAVWAPGGQYRTDTLIYGDAIDYNGAWGPEEILQVQAP